MKQETRLKRQLTETRKLRKQTLLLREEVADLSMTVTELERKIELIWHTIKQEAYRHAHLP